MVKKRVYHVRVSSSTTRGHRNWQAGELFTVGDATDLYEVDRWGKGYFSISSRRARARAPDEGSRARPSI